MAETEKKYTTAYGKLRRLTSTIDGQIRQISVSGSRVDSTIRVGFHPFSSKS